MIFNLTINEIEHLLMFVIFYMYNNQIGIFEVKLDKLIGLVMVMQEKKSWESSFRT